MHAGVAALFVVWVITNQWQCEFYYSYVCVHNNFGQNIGRAPAPPAPPPPPLPTPLLNLPIIHIIMLVFFFLLLLLSSLCYSV